MRKTRCKQLQCKYYYELKSKMSYVINFFIINIFWFIHVQRALTLYYIYFVKAFGRGNCKHSWNEIEHSHKLDNLEMCRKFCDMSETKECSHFEYNKSNGICVIYDTTNRNIECDLVFGPPQPAYKDCFPQIN